MSTTAVVVLIGGLAVIAVLIVWLLPRHQARRWAAQGIEGKELAALENGARGTLVQVLGGVALILTFVATWLQIADTRKVADRTFALTAAQQETERFTRAVEQLGSSRAEVRVGAIYALQRLARDEARRRTEVAELMLALLRSRHLRQTKDERMPLLEERVRILEHFRHQYVGPCDIRTVHALPDTQAALTVLLAIPPRERGPLNLAGLDLIGVRARDADFTGADLQFAQLAGADLAGANFQDALISNTDVRLACFKKARFNNARLHFTEDGGADFTDADAEHARSRPRELPTRG